MGLNLFNKYFKLSNKSGELFVCRGRLVRRRNYAGIDTGEQPMKMKMLGRSAMRAGAVALCSAALCAVPMMAQGGGGGGRWNLCTRCPNGNANHGSDPVCRPAGQDQADPRGRCGEDHCIADR